MQKRFVVRWLLVCVWLLGLGAEALAPLPAQAAPWALNFWLPEPKLRGWEVRLFKVQKAGSGWATEISTSDARLNSEAAYGFGESLAMAGDINGDGYGDVVVEVSSYSFSDTIPGFFVYYGTAMGISTIPAITRTDTQTESVWGNRVAGAGDLNGDGYADVIVGAAGYNGAYTSTGRADIYYGSAGGLNSVPDVVLEGDQAEALLGLSVAGAGDVNGDGYDDVIVGAPKYDAGETDEGVAFVYYGSATGVSVTPALTLEANLTDTIFGWSVAGVGDVNGDSYADVMVGNPYSGTLEHPLRGSAYLYYGSTEGLTTTPGLVLECDQDNGGLGNSVGTVGDLNYDGFNDIFVEVPSYQVDGVTGTVFIYYGALGGIVNPTPGITLSGHLGGNVAGVGDVNGDGYNDVLLGDSYTGKVLVYLGSLNGLSAADVITLEVDQSTSLTRHSVAALGDVNRDGAADMLVGAPNYNSGAGGLGAAFVYYGAMIGPNVAPATLLEGNLTGLELGGSVAAVGDINGDGYDDVVAGSQHYDHDEIDEGGALIYLGGATGLNVTPVMTLESNQAGAQFGYSVAGAGDLNGDGYDDVVVGADLYDEESLWDAGAAFVYYGGPAGLSVTSVVTLQSHQFGAFLGRSVSGAGDLNGDGYGDLLVGASGYDDGESNEGAVFVYYGGAAGLSVTPAVTLECNQATSRFGYSVAGGSDVNGDGYDDVLVGAMYYDRDQANEGAVFVYLGGMLGVSTAPIKILESNQASSSLGVSVAAAGDVNGDGYDDIVAGAMGYDNGESAEGAVFVFAGSQSGAVVTPVVILESNMAGAYFGSNVAGAGDVNEDGYADIVAGAQQYSNGQLIEGMASLYLGGAAGFAVTPTVLVEPNQREAYAGSSVAGRGDVNGDGYDDWMVGVSYYDKGEATEGAVFVYHGASNGMNPNLVVVKTVTPAVLVPGEAITYTIAFSNTGSGLAWGVEITDLLASEVMAPHSFSEMHPATRTLVPVDNVTYAWHVEALGPGEGGMITVMGIVAMPTSTRTVTNTAVITCEQVESRVDDNVSTVFFQIENGAPVLNFIGAKNVDELTELSFIATAVDPNDDAMIFSLDFGSAGSIEESNGLYSWTPSESDGPGVYTATVRVSDGMATSAETVSITVREVNAAPLALRDVFTVLQRSQANVFHVLTNDFDSEGNPLTVAAVGQGNHGGVVLYNSSVVTYTPAVDFSGEEVFTYTASDGLGGFATGWVSVTVTPVCDAVAGVDFIFSPMIPLGNEPVQFVSSVMTGTAPLTYSWEFGTGAIAQGSAVSYTYPNSRTFQVYTVTLTVANSCPSSMQVQKVVVVQPYRVFLPVVMRP